jgi:hypothetical protein
MIVAPEKLIKQERFRGDWHICSCGSMTSFSPARGVGKVLQTMRSLPGILAARDDRDGSGNLDC